MKNFNEINRTPIDIGVKKNLKFNFKSIVQNKARWLLTLIAILTLGVGQMWADDCGFWGDGAASITFTLNGSTDKTPSDLNGTGVSDYSIGTVTTSLTIKSAWAKVWGRDKFDGITLYYRVKEADASSSAAYSSASLGWDNNFGSNDQFWQNASINASIDIALAPGNYEIEYYFFADAKYESDKYLSNGSSNYHANFTIPSRNLTVAGAGSGNTVSGSVTGITKGVAYDITATPTTGYGFTGWSTSDSHITIANTSSPSTTVTFNNYSANATVTAGFALESTHDVTVSYKNNNSQTIKANTTESNVGESTARSVTAPSINDHTWSSWTVGNGIKNNTGNTTTNPININTKASGSYTLQANYTLVPCSLYIHTSSGTFATQEAKYLMSYDPDVDAYYYEITTTSSPYYFRFYHNNATQYSAAWAGDSYPNIQEATANGSKITCDQNVNSWENKSSVKFTGLSGSTIKIWFDYQNKKTWITETTYSVAVTSENAARGTVNAASVMAGKNTAASINATPVSNSGWMFKQWSVTSPASLVSSATTASNSVKATGGSGAVQAQFKHRYILRGSIDTDGDPVGGMAGWSATDNSAYTSSITSGVYTITANLTKAKTRYKFRIKDLTDGTVGNGQTGTGDIPNNTAWTLNGSNDVKLTTTSAGTYTFTYTVSTNSLQVVFPTSYTVTYGYGTGGTGVTATVSGETIGASPGYAESGADVVLSYTKHGGYDFKEWNTQQDGKGTKLGTGDTYTISSISANKTVYAIFTPQTYTSVKLDKNGGSTDGAYSVTYKGTSISVTTTPAKTGYHVDGYYKQSGLTNLIATSAGALQANTSYTNGSSQWTETSGQTLYTKWAANTYTADNNIDGNSGSNGKYTATYDATSIAINTAPTRTGYTLTGFHAYGRGANTLANASGVLTASQSENGNGNRALTDASQHWIYDNTDAVIYADWSANPYTITFNADDASRVGTATNVQATVTVHFDNNDYKVSSTSVTTVAIPVLNGYTFGGYYTAVNGGGEQIVNASGAWQSSKTNYTDGSGNWIKAANTTLFAKWTEDMHTVTVTTDGHGTITTPTAPATTVSAGIATGGSIAASASTGYTFYNWTKTSGSGTVTFTNANANSTTVKATSDATVRANFVDQWNLKGDQWDNWDTYKPVPYISTNTFRTTLTLTKGQKYKFKLVKRAYNGSGAETTDTWYGNTNTYGEKALGRGASAFTTATGGGVDDNLTVTPDVTGTYTFTINTSSTPTITVTYPTAYTVTFGMGDHAGSSTAITATASPSFSSGDYVLPETDITFGKGSTQTGYTWKGWYSNSDGTGTCHSSTDANLSWTATRTGNISVYACYDLVDYNITYTNMDGATNHVSNPDTYTIEDLAVTLYTPSKTGYTFNAWKAKNSSGSTVTSIAKGSKLQDTTFYATWTANNYTITLNCNGATSTTGVPESVTATYDATAPDSDGNDNYRFDDIAANPAKTGYTFAGWWTEGFVTEIITKDKYYKWNTSYVDGSGLWKYDGDLTVYAKWTPNNYAVTLSTSGETGYGSSAPSNQTATYGTALPTITPPVGASGYKFQGYFTSAGGAGTKYYNADGTSAHTWDIASATTLHAYFQKTVISTLEHPASIAKGDVITLDVNPVFNQTGATNYMDICWTLLYDNNNPVESGVAVASNPAEGKPNQVRFTLTGLASGYYKIQAVLKANASSPFDPCSTGTKLDSVTSDLRIAGNSKVTIQYKDDSGNTIAASSSVEVARGDSIGIKAPSIIGYAFDEWVLGDVLHNTCKDDATCDTDQDSINIKADYDGYLTASYEKKQMIYFNNTLGWDTVYVYFYNNGTYWGSTQGSGADVSYFSGAYTGKYGGMTKIPGTSIYYFDLAANSVSTSLTNVVFTDENQHGYGYFSHNNVIKLSDYSATLSMYVPLTGQTPEEKNTPENTSNYYWKGYWMNYPESTGYTLKIYDNTGAGALVKERNFEFPDNKAMPMSVTVDLEGGNKTYGFKIYRAGGTWFRNGGTMTNGHSGDEGQAAWEFGTESGTNCGLTTTSAGNYTFKVWVNSDGNHQVGVHYPESTGDFRVMYIDDVRITNHGGAGNEGKSWLLSSVIPADTEHDTISYFVRAEGSKHPKYKIQKCTISDEEEEDERTVSWADQGSAINVPDSITENSVYNFIFAKEDGNLVLKKIEPYEGNFYIRVDGAGSSNWDNFRASDHLMPYSDYSFNQTENPYSHYFTQWYKVEKVGGDVKVKNIKFVVANDYSVCVSDTIVQDGVADAYVDANGYITRSANIRFMYNYKTNVATRRYVDGAQESGSEFLMILSDDSKMYAASVGGAALTQLTFSDKGNWIYEAEVYALPTAQYKLRSKFGETATGDASVDWDKKGEITQYFKGGPSSYATLIGGDPESTTRVKIRLLYDFKTNRVVAAYQPSGTISDDMEIHADIMFIREHQEACEQITFASGKSISEIENIYCGLKFNKYTLNNLNKEAPHGLLPSLLSRYERDIFYVSFPYDVRLSDVIGFGTYGQHWIVEYYDGAARAANGFWLDSETYWKFVTPAMKDTFTLKAGTGYIVALDLDEMWYINDTYHADIWNNIDEVELLFPGDVSSISDKAVTYTMPEHTCTINRGTTYGDRRVKDSHWNVLGVPTFKTITGAASGDPDEGVGSGAIVFANKTWIKDSLKLKFIYDGNLADNSLTAKAVKGFEFKAMHSYVVQYCGNVTFTTSAASLPASIVASRTYADESQDVDFRLELSKNGVMEDQTFISLSNDENASAGFAFGEDLSKEFNGRRANIYTFIGTEWAAGNTLPMSDQTTIVPVGVKTVAEGEYTFSIPEGTYGVGITLIDNETGARTNLGLMDYTVNLSEGEFDNRFRLEISPIAQSSTDIEAVSDQQSAVRKVMIDGILYIVKDGKVFDARGVKVK